MTVYGVDSVEEAVRLARILRRDLGRGEEAVVTGWDCGDVAEAADRFCAIFPHLRRWDSPGSGIRVGRNIEFWHVERLLSLWANPAVVVLVRPDTIPPEGLRDILEGEPLERPEWAADGTLIRLPRSAYRDEVAPAETEMTGSLRLALALARPPHPNEI